MSRLNRYNTNKIIANQPPENNRYDSIRSPQQCVASLLVVRQSSERAVARSARIIQIKQNSCEYNILFSICIEIL